MVLQFFVLVHQNYFPLLIPARKYLDDDEKRPKTWSKAVFPLNSIYQALTHWNEKSFYNIKL